MGEELARREKMAPETPAALTEEPVGFGTAFWNRLRGNKSPRSAISRNARGGMKSALLAADVCLHRGGVAADLLGLAVFHHGFHPAYAVEPFLEHIALAGDEVFHWSSGAARRCRAGLDRPGEVLIEGIEHAAAGHGRVLAAFVGFHLCGGNNGDLRLELLRAGDALPFADDLGFLPHQPARGERMK